MRRRTKSNRRSVWVDAAPPLCRAACARSARGHSPPIERMPLRLATIMRGHRTFRPRFFSLERRCCNLSYPPGAGCPASRVGNLQKDCPKTDMRVSRDDNNHPSCAHPSSADVFKADKICWTPHKITVWQPCVLPIPAYGTKNPSSNQKADTLQPFFQFGKGAEVFGEKRSKGSTRRMI